MKIDVIKCTEENKGEPLIKYFESKGVNTTNTPNFVAPNSVRDYYGIENGKVGFYSAGFVDKHLAYFNIIELPKERTFPREMFVWDDDMTYIDSPNTVYAKIDHEFGWIADVGGDIIGFKNAIELEDHEEFKKIEGKIVKEQSKIAKSMAKIEKLRKKLNE